MATSGKTRSIDASAEGIVSWVIRIGVIFRNASLNIFMSDVQSLVKHKNGRLGCRMDGNNGNIIDGGFS